MYNTIISCEDLAQHLNDPSWVIFDTRYNLNDAEYGAREYAKSHLPGAVFMHMSQDLSGAKNGNNGRHPLPDPDTLAQKLGKAGVSKNTQVIVYDDSSGVAAGRLWWLLRWLGHEKVAVLDGGITHWIKAGRPLTADVPTPVACVFEAVVQKDYYLEAQAILAAMNTGELCIIDARSPDRFRGENETLDPVGGHIPGARNRWAKENLDAEGLFRPAAELRREFLALFAGVSPEEAIMQCGSGVSACHNMIALEIAGLSGSRLYPGSWSEWCLDPTRPIAR